MFKKFTKEDVHSRSNIKSSVQRGLKAKLVSQFEGLAPVIDDIIPKKSQLVQVKCEDKITLYAIEDEVIFFQLYDVLYPALRVVQKYPLCFPQVQVDRGAIKFVLSGANIMCPGLTSKGARLPDKEHALAKGSLVVVNAEGKENALAVGQLTIDTEEIKSLNKGIGIELAHYLGDGLWHFQLD